MTTPFLPPWVPSDATRAGPFRSPFTRPGTSMRAQPTSRLERFLRRRGMERAADVAHDVAMPGRFTMGRALAPTTFAARMAVEPLDWALTIPEVTQQMAEGDIGGGLLSAGLAALPVVPGTMARRATGVLGTPTKMTPEARAVLKTEVDESIRSVPEFRQSLFTDIQPGILSDVPQEPLNFADPRKVRGGAYRPNAVTQGRLAQAETRLTSGELNPVLEAGQPHAADTWYITDPLAQRFVDELGPERGRQAFERFISYVGASSPRSRLPRNLRSAGRAYYEDVGLGRTPSGYGFLAPGLIGDIVETGRLAPYRAPKAASFTENLLGNWEPGTFDAHFGRIVDYPFPGKSESLASGPYSQLVGPARSAAQRAADAGLIRTFGRSPTAPFQSQLWVGGLGETGVQSGVFPFLEHLEGRTGMTARTLGITPDEALRGFIRGQFPLR